MVNFATNNLHSERSGGGRRGLAVGEKGGGGERGENLTTAFVFCSLYISLIVYA